MDSRYHPQKIEAKWQKRWQADNLFKVVEAPDQKNIICSKCSRIHPVKSIWDM